MFFALKNTGLLGKAGLGLCLLLGLCGSSCAVFRGGRSAARYDGMRRYEVLMTVPGDAALAGLPADGVDIRVLDVEPVVFLSCRAVRVVFLARDDRSVNGYVEELRSCGLFGGLVRVRRVFNE